MWASIKTQEAIRPSWIALQKYMTCILAFSYCEMTWHTEPAHDKKLTEKHVPQWPELGTETWVCKPIDLGQLLVNIGEMLSDNSNQSSLHAVLFSSLVCIEKLQQNTWNALRYATWDCVFEWEAIQQAIQFLKRLGIRPKVLRLCVGKTCATAAVWCAWTSKPKQMVFGGKTAVCTHTPQIYATCGGYAVWQGLFSLPRHQKANDMTPTWVCSWAIPQKQVGNRILLFLFDVNFTESWRAFAYCCRNVFHTHHCTAQACNVLCHSVSW